MVRVLILRERAAAEETATALAAAGHHPLILPLEAYRTLDLHRQPEPCASDAERGSAGPLDLQPADHASFSAFVLTSPRAVPALAAFAPDRSRAVFAVGERTAGAARMAGFEDVRVAGGNASALAGTIVAARLRPGSRLLYAAGRTRTARLEAALASAGFDLVTREAYETVRLDVDASTATAALSGGPCDAVLVLSAGQASAFCALAETLPQFFTPRPMVAALSERIAEALAPSWRSRARVAEAPTLASLFECLG